MTKKWMYKGIFLAFTLVLAVLHLLPTIFPNIDLNSFPVKQRINLGLDLKGGLYMILGVEYPQVFRETLERRSRAIVDDMKERNFPIAEREIKADADPNDPVVRLVLADAAQAEAFRQEFKDRHGSEMRINLQEGAVFEFAFQMSSLDRMRSTTVEQAIEVIRNRVDQIGLKEPAITSHGQDKILIELPGESDVERAKDLIGQTARLEFQLVSDKLDPGALAKLIEEAENANASQFPEDLPLRDYVKKINTLTKDKLPEGTVIGFERIQDPTTGNVEGNRPYLLESQVDVTGEDLDDAFVSTHHENNMPIVSLNFNPRGGQKFADLTGNNIGRLLAIVLDGVVYSAPSLRSKIPDGKAYIEMGRGNYQTMMKEAKDLAVVLRAGALPAGIRFEEQRVVGPSLGADSIEAGKTASLIAFALVLFFMAFYYKGAGLISDIALVLNALFIFSILIGLEATLTLPGIAGIALTIGMAVDANVIIYERIREELRAGKEAVAALELGYQHAFRAILDANVTTALAALVLMEFGSGPIKGFAVTLLIGIITSLFTAVFVTRFLFDLWITRRAATQSVSISI